MNQELFTAMEAYIDTHFAAHDAALDGAIESLETANIPNMAITPAIGKLLHLLAQLCNARRILEIGTLTGYSTIWLARALPADGRLITLEYDAHHASVARANLARAGLSEQVEIREGRALDMLPQLAENHAATFDMVFIDADKPPYADYLEWSVRLTRPGGLIVADNVIRQGQVLDPENTNEQIVGIRRFNEMLAAHPALSATLLPLVGAKGFDGLALALVTGQGTA